MGDFGGGFNGDGGPPSGPPSLGGPDLGSVINLVFDAFRSLTNAINFVWGKLQWLYGILGGLFKGLRKFLSHIWKAYIKAAIGWLAKHAWSVQSWLGRHLKSAIKWMQKVKKWYDEHILKQQLRLLQQIQTIRRFLGILRLFHVKWATKLDNALGDLQNRVEQSISLVRGHINGIINWLNALSNPIWIAGLLHKGGFFIRSLDSLLRAAHLGGLSNWGPQSDQTGYGSQATGNMTGITESMHQDSATQTGSFNQFGKSGKATWDYLDNGWR